MAQHRHGQHVMDGQHEQAGQTEQREAGRLGRRPQATRSNERGDSQDDAPAGDANDPVVGRRRDIGAREQQLVGLVTQGQAVCPIGRRWRSKRPGGRYGDTPGLGERGSFAVPIADEHDRGHAHQDEIGHDHDDEQGQERSSRQRGRPRRARSGDDAPVGAILTARNARSNWAGPAFCLDEALSVAVPHRGQRVPHW